MGKKARITIEVECRMPKKGFLIPLMGGASKEQRMSYTLPCRGSGNMSEHCAAQRCRCAKCGDWDVKPL